MQTRVVQLEGNVCNVSKFVVEKGGEGNSRGGSMDR